MNLYVHIPFCLSKCRYCALYSESGRNDIASYPTLPAKEYLIRNGGTIKVKTVYFGGGTPGILGYDGLKSLVKSLKEAGIDFSEVSEWTVELNPAIISKELLSGLHKLGVNRLSFGVQIMDDKILESLGRRHNVADVIKAFKSARTYGFENIGLDLIAGLPNVTNGIWHKTLESAISLNPKHLSVYGLIVEPHTPLADDIENGVLTQPDDDEQMDIIAKTASILESHGLNRYEISNYAHKGYECRHNLACWRGEDYLGLGPAAASRISLERRTNAPNIDQWKKAVENGLLPPTENLETLTYEDDATERFVYGLRLKEGISPSQFAISHPAARTLVEKWESALEKLTKEGIAQQLSKGRWSLTQRGIEVADSAIETLL